MRKTTILDYLEKIAPIIPTPVYWFDSNYVLLGANKSCLEFIGAPADAVIGHTPYDYHPHEIAEGIVKSIQQVVQTGLITSQEDAICDITTGKVKSYIAVRAPLYDDDGKIIGVVGTSLETTAAKEAEQLRFANEVHKIEAKKQEEFRRIVDQAVHDIRSPLTSLDMFAKYCVALPESDRNSFREIAGSISNIANNLLGKYNSTYNHKQTSNISHDDVRQPLLVSTLLLQIIDDKKFQYKQIPVKFVVSINPDNYFDFINVEPVSLKRALSNLINNSVDAFTGDGGRIILKLESTADMVKIVVTDNGIGMPAALINKIMNDEAVSANKDNGHGIGLTQVRETLKRNQGKLVIDSIVDVGTSISLNFAKVSSPAWIATEVSLHSDDMLLILDDDNSIHRAWDARLNLINKAYPNIHVHHFKHGTEVLEFVHKLSAIEKAKTFLLADYELLQQEFTGLDVIKKSQIIRSILVTSHHNNLDVCENSTAINTKILPKQLATEVLIKITDTPNLNQSIPVKDCTVVTEDNLKTVDLILVDDDKLFVNSCIRFLFKDMVVDSYFMPEDLLNNIIQYKKDTKIAIDNHYADSPIVGKDLARQLHDLGFTNLYITSGEDPETIECNGYATPILKTNLTEIKMRLSKQPQHHIT